MAVSKKPSKLAARKSPKKTTKKSAAPPAGRKKSAKPAGKSAKKASPKVLPRVAQSGSRRALCVGINLYPLGGGASNLKGCVNDANAWANLFISRFGFSRENIKLLLDSDATRKNILEALRDMIARSKSGDLIAITAGLHSQELGTNLFEVHRVP